MENNFKNVQNIFKTSNYICESNLYTDELKDILKIAKEKGYKYIVQANDKMLSCWGGARNRKHIQLILCKTPEERFCIYNDVKFDNYFAYAKWYSIDDWERVINLIFKYSYTIRNNWYRCF